jgi:hypothetical protein
MSWLTPKPWIDALSTLKLEEVDNTAVEFHTPLKQANQLSSGAATKSVRNLTAKYLPTMCDNVTFVIVVTATLTLL